MRPKVCISRYSSDFFHGDMELIKGPEKYSFGITMPSLAVDGGWGSGYQNILHISLLLQRYSQIRHGCSQAGGQGGR